MAQAIWLFFKDIHGPEFMFYFPQVNPSSPEQRVFMFFLTCFLFLMKSAIFRLHTTVDCINQYFIPFLILRESVLSFVFLFQKAIIVFVFVFVLMEMASPY